MDRRAPQPPDLTRSPADFPFPAGERHAGRVHHFNEGRRRQDHDATANLGGLAADAGLRVLLLDLDVQPTLSSYYELTQRAPGGIYELLAFNERDLGCRSPARSSRAWTWCCPTTTGAS